MRSCSTRLRLTSWLARIWPTTALLPHDARRLKSVWWLRRQHNTWLRRTFVAPMITKKVALSHDPLNERWRVTELKQAARPWRAGDECGMLTKLISPEEDSLAGNRPHGLPAVRACAEHQRVPRGALLLEVGGVGPWGGTVRRAHQGAGVGAFRGTPALSSHGCPLFEDRVLTKRTKPPSRTVLSLPRCSFVTLIVCTQTTDQGVLVHRP